MKNTFGINIIPENDVERLAALRRYQILDTPSEESFDDLAMLATEVFDVPISLISLVDEEEVYFKANIGMGNAKKTQRGVSLCSLAVLSPEVTVFADPLNEPCLLTNPNVVGDFGLRFYAGAPITTPDGFHIGTLCIIDKITRNFSDKDQAILQRLAKVAMAEIELRLSARQEREKQQLINERAEAVNEELTASNEELSRSQREVELLNTELQEVNSGMHKINDSLSEKNAALTASQQALTLANARLSDSEEMRNLAIEQAQLGLWHIDAQTRAFIPSDRLKELFGYLPSEVMPYDAAVEQIREDYRQQVVEAVNTAIEKGTVYDIEFPVIGYRDGKLRWIRATGKLNPEEKGRKSYFSGMMMDITRQKEEETRKNDFISVVSHELKTPLTSMGGYIQLLQKILAKADHAQGLKILERASNQNRKMTLMIDSFLNLKVAESGKIPLYKSVFDMADLVREAESESQSTISTHKVIFAPVERTIVEADREKIGQVITNLLSNAVKYSPLGATINVACVTENGLARVSVRDEGIGIPEGEKQKLFSRFYRVERSETENIKGFGIGLYLCQQIIGEHQGAIGVQDNQPKGSVFWFTLPVMG